MNAMGLFNILNMSWSRLHMCNHMNLFRFTGFTKDVLYIHALVLSVFCHNENLAHEGNRIDHLLVVTQMMDVILLARDLDKNDAPNVAAIFLP